LKGITKIEIAKLRHRITIERITRAGDGQGGQVDTWVSVATVWASVDVVSQSERLWGQKLAYQRTHKIIMRYMSGITTDMRIVFGDRRFQIKSVVSPEERRAYLFIDAEENKAT
jgi:SPP1 family predicted phage head-tail adaptor